MRHDGQRKGFVNIKHNLVLLINTMSDRLKTLHMKFFTSHTLTLKKTVRLFQYFTSLTL